MEIKIYKNEQEKNCFQIDNGEEREFNYDNFDYLIDETYNNDKVLFQAHYVPTSQYTSPSFGDERLLPIDYWITLVKPDYYLLDNDGKDLYMFKTKPAPTRR